MPLLLRITQSVIRSVGQFNRFASVESDAHIDWEHLFLGLGRRLRERMTYKLFRAIHSFNGTMPYQQLPAQLGWSQRRMPPTFRFFKGKADVGVVVVRRRRASVVARRVCIVDALMSSRSVGEVGLGDDVVWMDVASDVY